MGKRKTTPGQVTPVLNKFKNKNRIAKQLWLLEAHFGKKQPSTCVKPKLNEDYADDRKMNFLIFELNWERKA